MFKKIEKIIEPFHEDKQPFEKEERQESQPNTPASEPKPSDPPKKSKAKEAFQKLVKEVIEKVDIRRDPTLLRFDIENRDSPHYRQELLTGKHLNKKIPRQVHQMTEEEREKCRLKAENGILYYANVKNEDGSDKNVDTSLIKNKDKQGFITFVIGEDNNLYIADRTAKYTGSDIFNHASFFSGRPVKFSGLIKIKDGKVEEYDDDSGHYYPDRDNSKVHMYNATKILQEKSVLSENCKLTCHIDEDEELETTPTKFINMMDTTSSATGKTKYLMQVEKMKQRAEETRQSYAEVVRNTGKGLQKLDQRLK